MVATLEITDGSTTLNLRGTVYTALMRASGIKPPPVQLALAGNSLSRQTYTPRRITISLKIAAASVSALQANIRALDRMLASAAERQFYSQSPVVLKTQLGNTDSSDIEYRVLRGSFRLPSTILDEVMVTTNIIVVNGLLSLLVEPFGRLAQVTIAQAELENEQDGSNLNYMDITSIAGTESSRTQIKIADEGTVAWNGSKTMWVFKRSGARRTDDLFIQGSEETSFTEGSDPSTGDTLEFSTNGALDITNDSGSSASVYLQWREPSGTETAQQGFLSTGRINYQIAGGSLPKGIFRVLARVQMEHEDGGVGWNLGTRSNELGWGLGYSFGSKTVTPAEADYVYMTASNFDTWETLDLGELVIPPTGLPDGYTGATLEIRIFTSTKFSTGSTIDNNAKLLWKLDYIFLGPFDEGMVAVSGVSASDRILIDNLSDAPGVSILNSSDVVQNAATKVGGPFNIGPEDTRLYVLRDDSGDPTTVKFDVDIKHTPQVIGM